MSRASERLELVRAVAVFFRSIVQEEEQARQELVERLLTTPPPTRHSDDHYNHEQQHHQAANSIIVGETQQSQLRSSDVSPTSENDAAGYRLHHDQQETTNVIDTHGTKRSPDSTPSLTLDRSPPKPINGTQDLRSAAAAAAVVVVVVGGSPSKDEEESPSVLRGSFSSAADAARRHSAELSSSTTIAAAAVARRGGEGLESLPDALRIGLSIVQTLEHEDRYEIVHEESDRIKCIRREKEAEFFQLTKSLRGRLRCERLQMERCYTLRVVQLALRWERERQKMDEIEVSRRLWHCNRDCARQQMEQLELEEREMVLTRDALQRSQWSRVERTARGEILERERELYEDGDMEEEETFGGDALMHVF